MFTEESIIFPAMDYGGRHLRIGWWSLLVFATLGLVLESLHGFKVRMYLDVSNDTRRLMWTLAHAHGTLLGAVNVLFGLTVRVLPSMADARQQLVSRLLVGATILLPSGFFLGGVSFYAGDPGLGILLLPVGAALLLAALYSIARAEPQPPAVRDKGAKRGV
jgi:predicted phage tail protein